MRIYEIAENYRTLFEAMDAEGELSEDKMQAYFDTLEGIEGEFDEKAENVACCIKELEVEVKALESEEKTLKARRKAKKNLQERLKALLIENMKMLGKKRIDAPKARITVRNNAESAICEAGDDAFKRYAIENKLYDVLTSKVTYELSKTKLKAAVESGKNFPGVHIGRTQSVIIK